MIFKWHENALTGKNAGETVRVEAWGKNALRVRATRLSDFTAKDHALTETVDVRVAEVKIEENFASITNGRITCCISKAGNLTFYDGDRLILAERVKNHMAPAREYNSLACDSFEISQYFDAGPDEKIYGMGQYQQPSLDLKGCVLELAQRNTQVSVPFALSNKGYGLLWNNPGIGEVVFGNNYTRYRSEVSDEIDYWICAGESPKSIIADYTAVTGRAPEFPEDALGLWQSKLRYRTEEELLSVAREYKRREIPLDVIVIDYFHWIREGDWSFDPDYWQDPDGMTRELHDMGIKCMVSVWPSVDRKSVNFKPMKERGLLVGADRGTGECMNIGHSTVFIDPYNPETREFVWEKLKGNYLSHGIDMFWLDVAEPEYLPADFRSYRYHEGAAVKVANKYPVMYTKMVYDGMGDAGKEKVVNLVRSAWVGSQKYGALVWSGDIKAEFAALREQLAAGLNIGLAGIPWWTTDTGGFISDVTAPEFNELLVRWFQFSTFCPVLRMHGDRGPYNIPALETNPDKNFGGGVHHTGQPNELWSYGEDVYKILRKYLDIRLSMKDYIKGLMDEASRNGSPVIRTMFYEFPEDPKCWDLSDQYMFGDRYLVAPVMYEGMRERDVYLPRGKWRSIHTGEVADGGCTVRADAPLDVIPVYERI